MVVSTLEGDDLILCQITSQYVRDSYAVPLNDKDFETGGLKAAEQRETQSHIHGGQSHCSIPGAGLKVDKLIEIIERNDRHYSKLNTFDFAKLLLISSSISYGNFL